MKKFLILSLLMIGMITGVSAQQVITMTHSGDTVTNAGTKFVSQESKAWYQTISIHAKVVKISGTVAGTLTLQGSNDGVNFVTIDTGATPSGTVTFTATNVATQSVIFIINGSPYRYYRVSYTGSGTMAARVYGYILGNK